MIFQAEHNISSTVAQHEEQSRIALKQEVDQSCVSLFLSRQENRLHEWNVALISEESRLQTWAETLRRVEQEAIGQGERVPVEPVDPFDVRSVFTQLAKADVASEDDEQTPVRFVQPLQSWAVAEAVGNAAVLETLTAVPDKFSSYMKSMNSLDQLLDATLFNSHRPTSELDSLTVEGLSDVTNTPSYSHEAPTASATISWTPVVQQQERRGHTASPSSFTPVSSRPTPSASSASPASRDSRRVSFDRRSPSPQLHKKGLVVGRPLSFEPSPRRQPRSVLLVVFVLHRYHLSLATSPPHSTARLMVTGNIVRVRPHRKMP
jgi:hypothetical protein